MATVTRGASGAGCNAAHPVPTAGPNVATTTATLAGDSRPAPGRLSEVRTKEGETTAAGATCHPTRGRTRRRTSPESTDCATDARLSERTHRRSTTCLLYTSDAAD